MKYILTFLFCFGVAYAQEPTYTPMKGAYRYKTIRVDSLFLVPSFTDTTAANATTIDAVAGAMIRCGNDFWMRNASLNAWLQNVNVGNGASPTVLYIDSIKRRSDTVYMKKNNTWLFAFKDSVPKADSPDRIDGGATNDVTADLSNNEMYFRNAKPFKIDADTVIIDAFVVLKNLSDGIVVADGNGLLNSVQKNWYGDNNVDLASQDYIATMPGVYTVTTGDVSSSYYFNLPSPAECQGRSLTIFNLDGTYSAPVTTPTGNIYEDASAVTITQIPSGKAVTLMSDGTNWRSTFKTF